MTLRQVFAVRLVSIALVEAATEFIAKAADDVGDITQRLLKQLEELQRQSGDSSDQTSSNPQPE